MPTTEWLNKYESIKDKLTCKVDLEAHFTEKVIGNIGLNNVYKSDTEGEIGICINPIYWGHDIATELGKEVQDDIISRTSHSNIC